VTKELYRLLGAKPIQWVRSSELGIPNMGRAEHLIGILKAVGATYYLANKNSTYLLKEVPRFEKAGIELEFADFIHEEYAQLYPPFVSGLSLIDMLMNLGPEKSLEHCQAGIFTRTPESRALCV
jgi:predicted nucleic acid-binding protein